LICQRDGFHRKMWSANTDFAGSDELGDTMTIRLMSSMTLLLCLVVVVGCSKDDENDPGTDVVDASPPEDTPAPPADTPAPPADTPAPPADTPAPPADTPAPPGDTPAPGDTPEPSTCTEEPTFHTCADGQQVPHCACSTLGFLCMDNPETQCSGYCHKEEAAQQPCPGAYESQPWCTCGNGSWNCDGLPGVGCPGQHCVMDAGGSDWTCSDGSTVPFCQCANDEPPCALECKTDPAEGWYNTCTGDLVEKMPCTGCTIACDKIGTKSEGWWADCGAGPEVVEWVFCGSGLWSCVDEPWTACAPLACKQEGEEFNLSDQFDVCCPGLVSKEKGLWSPGDSSCGWADCDCRICTACGDGACGIGEDPCTCPEDCGEPG